MNVFHMALEPYLAFFFLLQLTHSRLRLHVQSPVGEVPYPRPTILRCGVKLYIMHEDHDILINLTDLINSNSLKHSEPTAC